MGTDERSESCRGGAIRRLNGRLFYSRLGKIMKKKESNKKKGDSFSAERRNALKRIAAFGVGIGASALLFIAPDTAQAQYENYSEQNNDGEDGYEDGPSYMEYGDGVF